MFSHCGFMHKAVERVKSRLDPLYKAVERVKSRLDPLYDPFILRFSSSLPSLMLLLLAHK